LAEVRVLAVCPALDLDPDKLQKATAKEIRRIQRNEGCRRSHRQIRRCLRPQEIRSRPAKGDVPTDHSADPKTWNGPWQVLTYPEDIDLNSMCGLAVERLFWCERCK
jgi:hypothetical protein